MVPLLESAAHKSSSRFVEAESVSTLVPHNAPWNDCVSITLVNLRWMNPKRVLLTSADKCSAAPLLHLIKPWRGVSRTDANTDTHDCLLARHRRPSLRQPGIVQLSGWGGAVKEAWPIRVLSRSSGTLWPRLCWSHWRATSLNSHLCVPVRGS